MINKLDCHYCKKEFESKFFVPSRTPKYCSKECSYKGFMKPRIILDCITCSEKFEVINTSSKKYCSPKCIRSAVFLRGDPRLQSRLNTGFWKNSTWDEKLLKYKQMYELKAVKNSEGCWGWNSYKLNTGYGVVGPSGYTISAHRLSWLLHKGEIINNLWVLHKCNNPICTNPEHLYLGTPKENTRDMINANRRSNSQQNSKRTKLNKDKAHQIKDLLKQGFSLNKLANMYNVSAGTIQDIKQNRMWKEA